jgi:hypothetical protein
MSKVRTVLKQKTTWAGIAGLLSAVGGWYTGSIDVGTAGQIAITSLIGIFLRQGIAKGE